MLSRVSQTPAMVARVNGAVDEIRRSGELRRIADTYALPILIHQTLDSDWFRVLVFLGKLGSGRILPCRLPGAPRRRSKSR
jgi:hypothetical protein